MTTPDRPWCRVVVLDGDRPVATWELRGAGRPDVMTVDAVARLQLAAAQARRRVVLAAVDPGLRHLLALAGLVVEVAGQTEEGEDAPGVEEGVDGGDASP